MKYQMDDSIGQNKCLGDKCPNHCCSEKFIGLENCLEYKSKTASGEPLLDEDEYKRIYALSGNEYINIIDGKPYLKVLENNRCSAFKDGMSRFSLCPSFSTFLKCSSLIDLIPTLNV